MEIFLDYIFYRSNKFINIWVQSQFLFIRLKVLPLRTFCYLISQKFNVNKIKKKAV